MVQSLQSSTSLRKLGLSDISSDDEGFRILMNGLERRTSVQELTLTGHLSLLRFLPLDCQTLLMGICAIPFFIPCRTIETNDGARAIAYLLANNTSLRSLKLTTDFGTEDGNDILQIVFGAVARNNHLAELVIDGACCRGGIRVVQLQLPP